MSDETGRPRSPEGLVATAADQQALQQAAEAAFDYRGDVTITRRSAALPLEGYVFDRREQPGVGLVLRVVPRDGSSRVSVPLSDIARIEFSGKDTATGKSFETWVKKYLEKKQAGEAASIESEPLGEE
jgi:hypothetical protein